MQDAAVAERQAPPRRGHALRHSTGWPSITARQTASSSSSSSSGPTFEEWSNSMSELARPKPTASVHASPQVHNGAGGRACRLDLPAVAVATHHGCCAELACQALDDCGKPLTERGVVHGGLLWAGRQRPGQCRRRRAHPTSSDRSYGRAPRYGTSSTPCTGVSGRAGHVLADRGGASGAIGIQRCLSQTS
jgi:hypothetical protein